MKATGLLLLLAIVVIQTQARIYRWRTSELYDRSRREVEMHDWLTAEQKTELEPLKDKPTEFRDKVMAFYKQLPQEKQDEWNKFYKKHCVAWIKEVATETEVEELKQLKEKKDKKTLETKIRAYRERLPEEKRKQMEVWEDNCRELWKDELSRKRRDIDKNFEEFTKWMTPDQRKEVVDMKDAGKSFEELREKTIKYFEALPAEKQESLKEEFKGKCKEFFKKISKPEELDKMKSLHEAGNDAEVRNVLKEVIGRLSGDQQKLATKMEMLCTDVFAVKTKKRRDIDEKINRRLSWMTPDQKEEIKEMYADGKPQADIRAKIFEYLSALEGPAGIAAKEHTQKECYKWMEDVASAEEIAALHKMHETDHAGCKKKVREFMGRLSPDRKAEVEKNLPFCEKVWYGEHDHHSHHGHHGHRRHLAARRRRHLHAIDKFLDWLTPEQKTTLEDIEKSGSHFDEVIAKVKEYYSALPEEKKAELKANFKSQCSAWVKEVATTEEMDNIKKLHEAKDHAELKKILLELENRLTEEQKHTVEHVREVCLGVWELQSTRRRRDHHEHHIDEDMKKYLTWMTEEQRAKVKEAFDKGEKKAGYDMVMKMFESSSGDVKAKAAEELKAACKHYGRDILGDKNADILKEMEQSGATNEAISKRVLEMVEEITEDDRKMKAQHLADGCRKIYGVGVSRVRRDHHEHNIDEEMGKYLTWLTDEQKGKVKETFEKGDREAGYKMIMEMFESSSGDVKTKASEELKAACKHYGRDLLGDKNADIIKEMKESGATHEAISKKVDEFIAEITDEEKRKKAERLTAGCKKIYGAARVRRDHHEHNIDEEMGKYLTWLSDEQKGKVKETFEKGDREAGYKMIMEMFESSSGDVKAKASEELKAACKHYGRDLPGDKNADIIKDMKESGATHEAISKKVDEFIAEITDEEKRKKAERLTAGCKKIYGAARVRRDHHHHSLEEAFQKYLTWLNDDQKSELKSMKESGDKEGIYKKIMEFFDSTSGDVKQKAAEELQAACKHYIKDFVGEDKAMEFKKMKESGVPVDEIAKKVEEAIEEISDDTVKSKAKKASVACKRVFGVSKRFRRGHHEHSFEEAMEKYLTWLTADQKIEIKSIYDAGDKAAMYERIMEVFDAATGETKEQATKELKGACKHYVKDLIGDENAEKIREMKDSGASNDEIATKVEEMIEAIADDKKKSQALRASTYCKKIFSTARRLRRDHHDHDHQHNLEEAMEKYLAWLNDDQKAEVKKLFESDGRPAVYKKIMDYFESASGEVKEQAKTELQAACKHYVKDHIGKENAEKLKEMKDSGATKEAIAAKVDEFIAAITDEKEKEQATRAAAACKKIYGVASRRLRRDHHEHTLDEAMEKYLTWLNDDQKAEVKKFFESGDRAELYKKVLEYFDASSGEVKEKAAFELKAACRHYIKDSIGEENAAKIKEMKDSGASHEEISAKVDEFINAITDEKKKEQAIRAAKGCKKVYGVAQRMKRDHHDHAHNLKEAMEKYLTWLSEDQKAEVKKLFEEEGRPSAYKKVMEYFDSASGEVKEKAATELKAACKHYVKDYIGEENAEKIKEMKDSGATKEAISAKVDEFIAAITDEKRKEQALKAAEDCKKIYGVARRLRRDHHHEHNLEEAMKNYLTWMNDEQKTEIKNALKGGDRLAAYKKVMEFYDATSGETKAKAATELKAACKHYVKELIGEEKAARIRHLKESGATNEVIAQELDAIISLIPNEKKRIQAKHAAADCKKIYGLARRMRRDHHEHTLEEALQNYLTWLDDDQKGELKQMKEKGDREAIYKKVMEYFEAASGDKKAKATEELQSGCKHYIMSYVGKEKADELKKLKDSGISKEEIAKKVDEAIEAIADEETKAKAKKAATSCRKVFGVTKARRHLAARRRRHRPHTFIPEI